MTQVNTILEELRKELTEAEYLVDTTCGDTLPHWEGRRDALKNAITIVEKATPQTTAELLAALRERDGVVSHAPDRTSWTSVDYGDGISWGTRTTAGDLVIVAREEPES